MNKVKSQYEAFPYPERRPEDERKRLITGSPSIPVEIDHYLFGGQRDWRQKMRVLFAGGGSGDGLIQFAHYMQLVGRPCEITYLDLSENARAVAEARAQMRGLSGIRFETGSLLDAGDYGAFDYIDCCGVLHHLPNPLAGFQALERALAPEGGIGAMVYAPYGRAGVYPLQAAFNALYGDLPAEEALTRARAVFDAVPKGHPFKRNPHLGDHKISDAGFFDLLMHSQDQAFDVPGLLQVLDQAGLRLTSLLPAARYDLSRFVEAVPDGLDEAASWALAEQLSGEIKLHVFYAARKAEASRQVAKGPAPQLVPHLIGAEGRGAGPSVGQARAAGD